ncbi:hypothetical protein BC835DRAFT_1420977 [Cytidiella melzeri]|nr:hypothetical protein BC835DRAFT_1420977 [Cytidiella melzeri]
MLSALVIEWVKPSLLALLIGRANRFFVDISLPRNCEFALATLGIYDYLITLEQERRQIWKRKLSWISVLFVVNRYVTLATSFVMFIKDIPVVAPNSQTNFHFRCINLVLVQIVADALLSICAGCFYAAQTYALFDRPTVLLFLVSALGLATPVISVAVWAKAATINLSTNLLGERCSALTALETGVYDDLPPATRSDFPRSGSYTIGIIFLGLITARACNLAANCLVFALIVWRTMQTLRLIGGSSISKMLFRQGGLHFV